MLNSHFSRLLAAGLACFAVLFASSLGAEPLAEKSFSLTPPSAERPDTEKQTASDAASITIPAAFATAEAFAEWWRKPASRKNPSVAAQGLMRALPWLASGAFVNLMGREREKVEAGLFAAETLLREVKRRPETLSLMENTWQAAEDKDRPETKSLEWLILAAKNAGVPPDLPISELPQEEWGLTLNLWWAEYLAVRERAPLERIIGTLAYFPPASKDRAQIDLALSALDILSFAARHDKNALAICQEWRENTTNEAIADALRLVIDAARRKKTSQEQGD